MISQPESNSFDVVVVGSGASGLACAVACAEFGLKVCVIEKAAQLGGTSAWSGGWLWAPENHYSAEAGGPENGGHWAYLSAEIGEGNLSDRLTRFVEAAPEMVRFFADKTEVKFFNGAGVADFHSRQPGARSGHRAICAQPFDGRALGKDLKYLRQPLDLLSPFGMGIAPGPDLSSFFNWRNSAKAFTHVLTRVSAAWRDRLAAGRPLHLVNGNALIARLLLSAKQRGVTFHLETSAQSLVKEGARVTGIICSSPKGQITLQTRAAVVLAAGGFPHNAALRGRAYPTEAQAEQHFSAAPLTNTGDGLRLAEEAGGQLNFNLSSPAGQVPVSVVPREKGHPHFPHLTDRAKPGCIMVDLKGQRFCNEAESYHDVTNALYQASKDQPEIAGWIIADAASVARYGLGYVRPFPFPKRRLIKSGYVKVAKSVPELARKCGLPEKALVQTFEMFNAGAMAGEDRDFGRGATLFNRVTGDMTAQGHPTLAPLRQAPFYAVKIRAGSLSTFAGIQTDVDARVRSATPEGNAISGLYAIGNDASSVANGAYPAGGFTLGPGMTFGYLAAKAIKAEAEGQKLL